MNGYVLNKQPVWAHVLKRKVKPGGKIPLAEIYNEYGVKHGLSEGEEFIGWLRSVKLRDIEKWKIVYVSEEEEKAIEKDKDISPIDISIDEKVGSKQPDNVTPLVAKKMEVADVVNLSVRKAREVIPKVIDLNLLKYSLQEASPLAGKDSLCRILRKRIQEIQISR